MPAQFITAAVQFAQSNPIAGAVAAAIIVGSTHFLAHKLAGDEWAFEEAGVMQAGLTVMLVAGVLAWMLLSGVGA